MTIHTRFPDQDLLEKLSQNDATAFREIYKVFWYELYKAAYKMVRNEEASEKIVQNIFTLLWFNRAKLSIKISLGPYLFDSLKFAVIEFLEHEASREKNISLAYHIDNSTDSSTKDQIDSLNLKNYLQQGVEKNTFQMLTYSCVEPETVQRKPYDYPIIKKIKKTAENYFTNKLSMIRATCKYFH